MFSLELGPLNHCQNLGFFSRKLRVPFRNLSEQAANLVRVTFTTEHQNQIAPAPIIGDAHTRPRRRNEDEVRHHLTRQRNARGLALVASRFRLAIAHLPKFQKASLFLAGFHELYTPYFRPLLKISPFEFALLNEIKLVENRLGVVVNHQDKRLAGFQLSVSFENQRMALRVGYPTNVNR